MEEIKDGVSGGGPDAQLWLSNDGNTYGFYCPEMRKLKNYETLTEPFTNRVEEAGIQVKYMDLGASTYGGLVFEVPTGQLEAFKTICEEQGVNLTGKNNKGRRSRT